MSSGPPCTTMRNLSALSAVSYLKDGVLGYAQRSQSCSWGTPGRVDRSSAIERTGHVPSLGLVRICFRSLAHVQAGSRSDLMEIAPRCRSLVSGNAQTSSQCGHTVAVRKSVAGRLRLALQWVDGVHLSDQTVTIDLGREAVKAAPPTTGRPPCSGTYTTITLLTGTTIRRSSAKSEASAGGRAALRNDLGSN